MAAICNFQYGGDGAGVSHLSHYHDVGILAQGLYGTFLKAEDIRTYFPVADQALFRLMDVFDRISDNNHRPFIFAVIHIDDRVEC